MAAANTLGLHLSQGTTYEAGAALLTEVALGLDDSNKWSRPTMHAALCGHILRWTAELSEEWRWTPQYVKPGYLLVPADEVDRAIRFVAKRINQRLMAAHTAIPFLQQLVAPSKPLPAGLEPLSLNRATEHTLLGSDRYDGHNFEARVFRPSKPVLHIACAMALAVDEAERRGSKLAIEHFLAFPELLRWTAEMSNQIADLLVQQAQFKIEAGSLVRVTVV
jgi:hypothetical protein